MLSATDIDADMLIRIPGDGPAVVCVLFLNQPGWSGDKVRFGYVDYAPAQYFVAPVHFSQWKIVVHEIWIDTRNGGVGGYMTSVDVHPAYPLIGFAAYPAFAFIRGPLRRWRRRKRGSCIRCGYNLEGNVSGVCPECGETR